MREADNRCIESGEGWCPGKPMERRIRNLKNTLRENPLSKPLYGLVRSAYIFAIRYWDRPLRAGLRWRARKQGFKHFRWDGLVLKESWDDRWMVGAMTGRLKIFTEMKNLAETFAGPAPVIFDIGANIGLFSLCCSRIPGAMIYGFEPVLRTYKFFEENVRNNAIKNVECIRLGLSDTVGRMMIGPVSERSDSAQYSVYTPVDREFAARLSEEAEFVTLDHFVSERNIEALNFIKIDAEGHDINVMTGGMESIERFRPVIQIEYVTDVYRRVGVNRKELSKLVQDLKYKIFLPYKNNLQEIEDTAKFFDLEEVNADLILVPRP